MDQPSRRNFLVGVTVLFALLVFAWMILNFGEKSAGIFTPAKMPLHFDAARATGLSEGSSVNYLGVPVGTVTSVERSADGKGVRIEATVRRTPPLPANIYGKIVQYSAIGSGSDLDIEYTGDQPEGELQPDAQLQAKYVGLQLNLLPPEYANTASEIGRMSLEIRKIAEQLRESGTLKDIDTAVKNLNIQITKAGNAMDSANAILGDETNRQNIKQALANIRNTSDRLQTLGDSIQKASDNASTAVKDVQIRVDDLSKQTGDRILQISTVLTNLQSVMEKIDTGKGSAGQLVNDPRLYQSLVDSSRELAATTADLHRLVQQWEQEGVTIHLSK
jgi:phospholipid/cholesterol/gamma-HCH transport system substrate-binding protein